MIRSYADTGGNVNEEIKLLNSISHVSARLARNLTILAADRQSEENRQIIVNYNQIISITQGKICLNWRFY